MLGEDYLRMYITKLQKTEHVTPFEPDQPWDKSLLVVGGGIAGRAIGWADGLGVSISRSRSGHPIVNWKTLELRR